MEKIQSIRGMNDLLPGESGHWQFVERTLAQVVGLYGYQEIRTPIAEHTALFKRSIGEATDIVEKEMYTFADKGGDSLTLRPENTASCMRAGIEHGLFHNQKQKFWYMGPMFRHERPQKGRYRQFHQFGCEAIGWPGPDIDAELIQMTARFLKKLGLEHIKLELNSIGTPQERSRYRQQLVSYFEKYFDALDDDSKRRLKTNPLRIFDSKAPATQEIVNDAPLLTSYLSEESNSHFQQLCQSLDEFGIEYSINPRLVRGLDYYSLTVFEWITDQLGAQNAVLAGGRYDGLVEQLGGKPTPGIGFAMGLERLVELLKLSTETVHSDYLTQIYVVTDNSEQAISLATQFSEQLRDHDLNTVIHFGGGSFKSQFKKADQSGACIAAVIGEAELAANQITIKPLRSSQDQFQLEFNQKLANDSLSMLLNLLPQ